MSVRANSVSKDEVQDVKRCRKAADQGDAKAQYNLGVKYANGERVTRGVPDQSRPLNEEAMQLRVLFSLTATLLCAACLAVTPSTGLQAAEFHPIISVQSSTADADLWPAANLMQGPGVGFDANSPYDKLSGGADGNWVTDAPGGVPSDYMENGVPPELDFDLGQNRSLSEISVWGFAASDANGASKFSLLFATESDGPDGFGTSVLYNPLFSGLANDDTVRQSFLFQQTVVARYVRFTVIDNFFVAPGDGSGGETPGGDRVGLGEVGFTKPSALLLPVLEIVTFSIGEIDGVLLSWETVFRNVHLQRASSPQGPWNEVAVTPAPDEDRRTYVALTDLSSPEFFRLSAGIL